MEVTSNGALGYAQRVSGAETGYMETAQNNSAHEAATRLGQLKPLLTADPGNDRLARECIELALQAGDFGFVIERADKTLAASPSDPQALFDRASALMGACDYRDAIVSLRAVLERVPDAAAAQFNLGLCHYCLSEYPQARRPLEAAHAAGDASAGLLRVLVSTLHHLGEIDEAVKLCDENAPAAESDGALAGVYALAYLDANRADAAARWAATALRSNPDSLDGLVVQGTLSTARMDLGRARAAFERALQLAPSTGRAWIGLGMLALLANDPRNAITLIERGLQSMPAHVGSWHALGWAHLVSNDLDAAEAVFGRAMELDRNFAESHGALASIAALRGRRAEAQRAIDVALRLDPKCLGAQFARSVLTRSAGDSSNAERIIQAALAELRASSGGVLGKLMERATRH